MTDTRTPSWAAGDHLTHRFNPELGIGRVTAIDGRALVVEFPGRHDAAPGGRHRRAGARRPQPGRPVRVSATREETRSRRVARRTAAARQRRAEPPTRCGRSSSNARCSIAWRSATLDDAGDFLTRLDILHLRRVREADGLGSFLGGRVRLFPHQLHVAERATAQRPGALAAGRRSRPRQDDRGVPDPQPSRAHAPHRALPGGGAGRADGAVARRAVAQVSPGVHAARRAAPRRRRARLRRRLQSVRAAPPRGDRARNADRATAS